MSLRVQLALLVLVCLQALHSAEEYVAQLYDVFAPATFVSGLVSADLSRGFLIINTAFVAFGAWSYLLVRRSTRRDVLVLAWFWAAIELANGAGHVLLALSVGHYFPGLLTAPFLFVCATCLATFLYRDHSSNCGRHQTTEI